MKAVLLGAAAVSILAVSACTCLLILSARLTVDRLPGLVLQQVAELRIDAFTEIDAQASAILGQLNGISRATFSRLAAIQADANSQATGLRQDLKASVALAVAPLTGIRADLQPVLEHTTVVLANVAKLTQDTQDSLDDLYPDVRAAVESATVATTQAAQTLEAVNQAAPQISADIRRMADSGTVIADSAAKEAQEFTKPRTRRQKLMLWLELVPRLAIKIL